MAERWRSIDTPPSNLTAPSVVQNHSPSSLCHHGCPCLATSNAILSINGDPPRIPPKRGVRRGGRARLGGAHTRGSRLGDQLPTRSAICPPPHPLTAHSTPKPPLQVPPSRSPRPWASRCWIPPPWWIPAPCLPRPVCPQLTAESRFIRTDPGLPPERRSRLGGL